MDVSTQRMSSALTLRRSPRRPSPKRTPKQEDEPKTSIVKTPTRRSRSPERRCKTSPRRRPRSHNLSPSRFHTPAGTTLLDDDENDLYSSHPTELLSQTIKRELLSSPDEVQEPPPVHVSPKPYFGQLAPIPRSSSFFGNPVPTYAYFGKPLPPTESIVEASVWPSALREPLSGPNDHFGPELVATGNMGLMAPPPRPPKRPNLPSFVDTLDREIANWTPTTRGTPPSPPPGILNLPYNIDAREETPDALDPRYDSDWDERLFDPVPGAGVYLGELMDIEHTPKDQNVVYASIGIYGEVVVKALPFNRRGNKIMLENEGAVKFEEILFRRSFGRKWVGRGLIEDVRECARERLRKKVRLDYKREVRFERDIQKFWEKKRIE